MATRGIVGGHGKGCVPQQGVQIGPAVKDVRNAGIVGSDIGVWKHLSVEQLGQEQCMLCKEVLALS